ncbi:MAG: ribosome maturation factor RimP [Ruminococcaceae bacterium]|nr:ribosome maturation factor RimP [Oscillospiraceae bacterium]
MAKKQGGNVVTAVRAIAEPLAESLGYFIWDVEYVREGAQWYLRITIDSEDGINIEDCEKMHRAIDPLLDEADPIEEAYNLEVSSPGIERDLKNDMQISACVDWDVEVKLYAPLDGSKLYRGVLLGLTEEGDIGIRLQDGEEKIFNRASVAKISTVFDFDAK